MGIRKYLIDEDGEIWPSGSMQLRRQLFCLSYDGDLVHDIVRNLGFIGLEVGSDRVSVRLHSRTVAPAAVVGLFFWKRDNEPKHVTINFEGETRPIEVLYSTSAAVERLGTIDLEAKLRRQVRADHLRLDHLVEPEPLGRVFKFWRERHGTCELKDLVSLARQFLEGRYVAVSADTLSILDSGEGLQIPDRQSLGATRGSRLDEHPDPVYRQWVVDCYNSVIVSGRPDLSDVEADIYWASTGTVRRTYRRLLIPCRDSAGKSFLFGANSNRTRLVGLRQTA